MPTLSITNEAASKAVNKLGASILALRAQIRALESTLVGENTVIRTSPGLYLKNFKAAFKPVSLVDATRWSYADAEKIADGLPRMPQWQPLCVKLVDALRLELADETNLYNELKAGLAAA
jgi:hypothetical protein